MEFARVHRVHGIQRINPNTAVADLHADGVHLKCMLQAGVPVVKILGFAVAAKWDVGDTAVALRDGGCSLKELVLARTHFRLVDHPPVTKQTLFDSQLKDAGFSASDFRAAGFDAR